MPFCPHFFKFNVKILRRRPEMYSSSSMSSSSSSSDGESLVVSFQRFSKITLKLLHDICIIYTTR